MLAELLEDRTLLAVDYGDAPDPRMGVAAGDYQTTEIDNGAAHTIVPGLYLGKWVDGDDGTLEGSGAEADDHTTVLADLARDYRVGVDPADLSAGESFSPRAAGGGSWQYLLSNTTNPSDIGSNLRSMAWDTGMNAFEDPEFDHQDGSNGFYIGFPNEEELAFRPFTFAGNRRAVARWTAGPQDAGEVVIEGRVRKTDTTRSDGIRLVVYIDGAAVLDQAILGEDGRGFAFTLPEITASQGTVVDLVVDANGRGDFDSTRLSATITRGDDEDGLVGGSLEDFDLVPGRKPEIELTATNQTADEAVLAGWIDYNRDGVFDNATERGIATVPADSRDASVTMVFPEPPADAVYTTYARFRLSTDVDFVADPQPIGLVDSGEVEDYLVGRVEHVWDGEAGDTDVFNAANWAQRTADGETIPSNRVPRYTDNVIIPEAFSGETLRIKTTGNDRFRVRSMRSSASLLVQEKGLLEFNADSQIAGLTLDGIRTAFGDSLASPGNRPRLLIDGDLVWNEAQINSLVIEVGGDLTIATDRPHSLIRGSIRVFGDDSVWSGGDVNGTGAQIYNHGTLTTTSNSDATGAGNSFINLPGATWIHDAPLLVDDEKDLFGTIVNHGLLEVRSGSMSLGDCCSSVTHLGSFRLRPETEMTFRSRITLAPESTLEAEAGSRVVLEAASTSVNTDLEIDGTLVVEGSVDLTTPLTVPRLVMQSGSIVTSQPVTVTEDFQLLGGTLQGSQFTSEGSLTLGAPDDESSITLRWTRLINRGEATWVGRDVGFGDGVIQNDGTFLDASDESMFTGLFSDGSVENNGTWTVAESVGAGGIARRESRFINRGRFETGQSNIRFYSFDQDDGALQLGGGTVEVYGRDLLVNGGTLSGTGQLITSVTQSGGIVSPGLTSPGGSAGILSIDGDLDATAGQLRLEITGPPVDGQGDDLAGITFDRLAVSGNANLNDVTLTVIDGYQPVVGDQYVAVTGSAVNVAGGDNASEVGLATTLLPNRLRIEVLEDLVGETYEVDFGFEDGFAPGFSLAEINGQLFGSGMSIEAAADSLGIEPRANLQIDPDDDNVLWLSAATQIETADLLLNFDAAVSAVAVTFADNTQVPDPVSVSLTAYDHTGTVDIVNTPSIATVSGTEPTTLIIRGEGIRAVQIESASGEVFVDKIQVTGGAQFDPANVAEQFNTGVTQLASLLPSWASLLDVTEVELPFVEETLASLFGLNESGGPISDQGLAGRGGRRNDRDAAGSSDRQPLRDAASQRVSIGDLRFGELGAEHRVGVLVDLLGRLEVHLVTPIVFELTLVGRVITADLWAGLVDSAHVVFAEMLARRVDQQVPNVVVDEHRGPVV